VGLEQHCALRGGRTEVRPLLPSSSVDRRSAVTAVLTQRALSLRAASRWVHDCANGKDGVVKAPAGQYVLRYRSAKREMQLVSVA
jgi:hypothetical protein